MPNSNLRCSRRTLCVRLLWPVCLAVAGFLHAQESDLPTVGFSCDFPGSDPSHYGFSVSADGRTSYISDGKLNKDSNPDEEPFRTDLTLSQPTVSHIFDLAKQAKYFEGNIDSKRKNVASTGAKTLFYKDAKKGRMANYDYSTLPAVQELTALFQNLSATLEFGRRLDYDERYQKLALDEELKHMENVAKMGGLAEVSMVAPVLQKIADDPAVINEVRARAQRLLQGVGTTGK